MTFSEEVAAFKKAWEDAEAGAVRQRVEAGEAHQAARAAFDEEIADLWRSAQEYWGANARRMNAAEIQYIADGTYSGPTDETATLPFPRIDTWQAPHTDLAIVDADGNLVQVRRGWDEGDRIFSAFEEGIDVSGWFALAAPGELRVIRNDNEDGGKYRYETVSGHGARPVLGDPTIPAYCVLLYGRKNSMPEVAVRRTVDQPAEIWTRTGMTSFTRKGSLREYVVAAVAKLPLGNES
ncbi:hypothetical protein [Leifsonia sp. 1010]|uniref:hypothetical protein n=1 Tax=Leifsonia sp. 1010 TaxID=2817769 RepID=UPI002857FF39|nr:hypothetical protein [Leifsonia sp. 1010]MDR6612544.1 hypothetical protein [Leifsonia sp. 1010]